MGFKSHTGLTLWSSHIPKFGENCWYKITDLAVKNYYGIELSTTPTTIIGKKEIDVELDWSDIDVKEYLNHENQTVNSLMRVLRNAKIKEVLLNIFKRCSNEQCVNKVEFTAGGIFDDCGIYSVKMLKEDCIKKC